MSGTHSALLTDLYQLTMLQGYFRAGMTGEAVFELFTRRLPSGRNFLLAAGLEQLLDYLEELHFTPRELAWLADSGRFSQPFLDHLQNFRFHGEVYAMAEGTPFFANEPMLRIHAPLPEAQFVESRTINLLHYQTLVASKAVRCVLAAPDRLLVDFGMRRAHGAEAALFAARAAYLAGFSGSATVEAGTRFAIPIFGTMAHAYIEAHDSEEAAFLSFAASQPDNTVLLIDTYDTARGARLVAALAPQLASLGATIKAVRIDSGDLAVEARRVRKILDEAGLDKTGIFASGDLDEHRLAEFVQARVPIDGFGVGSRLATSSDAPYLDCAYKLQSYAGRPRRKRSPGKATWPGAKQVWRRHDARGRACGDIVTLADRDLTAEAEPLLAKVMSNGRRITPSPGLEAVRERTRERIAELPEALRAVDRQADYPVEIAPELVALAKRADAELEAGVERSGRAKHHPHQV